MAEDTYVHEPDAGSDGADAVDDDGGDESGAADWVAAAVVAVCLVAAPVAILFWPPTFLPYRDAYLGLSLVPGLVLGAVGVWTAYRATR